MPTLVQLRQAIRKAGRDSSATAPINGTLRMFLLAAAPFGISYDISVGAAPALCGAIVSAALAFLMLMRELKARRDQVELAYYAASELLV